jgi:hypothetical protein
VLIIAATFTAPRPEPPSYHWDLTVRLEITHAADINPTNNITEAGVRFVMDRDGFALRDIPEEPAQLEGRP